MNDESSIFLLVATTVFGLIAYGAMLYRQHQLDDPSNLSVVYSTNLIEQIIIESALLYQVKIFRQSGSEHDVLLFTDRDEALKRVRLCLKLAKIDAVSIDENSADFFSCSRAFYSGGSRSEGKRIGSIELSILQRMPLSEVDLGAENHDLSVNLPIGTTSLIDLSSSKKYTDLVDEIKQLKRDKSYVEAERLLLVAIEACEEEAKNRGDSWGVAPWYYEQLAIIYRKQKMWNKEISVLERYESMPKYNGIGSSRLKERLQKALDKQR